MPNDLQSPLDRHIVTFMDRLTAENYKPQTIKAYRGLLKRLISLIEAAGISPQDLTAERAAELVRNDVLPKALPVLTGVRGWYGATRGGVAQPAWPPRRAAARQPHYAAAQGWSRGAGAQRRAAGRDRVGEE